VEICDQTGLALYGGRKCQSRLSTAPTAPSKKFQNQAEYFWDRRWMPRMQQRCPQSALSKA
jgi:hypothetical protein